MAKKKKLSTRAQIGKLAKSEGGKSQATMGDVMQLQALFFEQCCKDPVFMSKGLQRASARLLTRKNLRAKARAKK